MMASQAGFAQDGFGEFIRSRCGGEGQGERSHGLEWTPVMPAIDGDRGLSFLPNENSGLFLHHSQFRIAS